MLLICPAADKAVQGHFQPVQALVVQSHEAKHIGGHGAIGIETAAFIEETEALPALFLNEGDNLIRIFGVHNPFHPHETGVLGQVLFQIPFLPVKERRQFLCRLCGAHVHGARVRIERFHHNGKGQFPAVPVINGASGGIEGLHPFRLVHGHFLIVMAPHNLHPHETKEQKTSYEADEKGKFHASLPHPISGQFLPHGPFSS